MVAPAEIDVPLDRLRALLREMGSVLVTFSGGVDSALVTRIAHEELGERAVALTAESPTLPPEEAEEARRAAVEIGIRHLVVESQELEVEGYARNDGSRCYFCKSELFALAEDRRRSLGLDWVVDGTLLDDLGDHRPGLKAAAENRVRHPLVEAGLDKAAVRAAARTLGMSVWDKPSFACLGSRFPVGTRVSYPKIVKVLKAESALRRLGFRQFRVRYHEIGEDVLARIEVEPADVPALAAPKVRDELVRLCREVGFRWVTLDLVGYRAPDGMPGEASSERSSSSG